MGFASAKPTLRNRRRDFAACLTPLTFNLRNAGGAAQAGHDLVEVAQVADFDIDQGFEKILLALDDFQIRYGAFLLGEMAPHTENGGQIYFPAGTPDPSDVFDSKVDLEASACRELHEETGVKAEEAIIGATWTIVFAGSRIDASNR